VQGAAEFHHQITALLLPQAQPVFDDPTALDAAVDVLDAATAVIQDLVGQLLPQSEFLTTGFLRRYDLPQPGAA
jgi:hypothetical protein